MTEEAPVRRRAVKIRDDLRDPDLEWFIHCGASTMREKGTLQSVTGVLECGGAPSGMPIHDIDAFTDEHFGWGNAYKAGRPGSIERHRWLTKCWAKLAPETKNMLLLCYSQPSTAIRADSKTIGFVTGQLGEYSALAFAISEEPHVLLQACRDANRTGSQRVIGAAIRDCQVRSREVHEQWWRVKTGKPRRGQRVAELPVHVPVNNVDETAYD